MSLQDICVSFSKAAYSHGSMYHKNIMRMFRWKKILEPLVQRTGRFKESQIPFTLLRPHKNNKIMLIMSVILPQTPWQLRGMGLPGRSQVFPPSSCLHCSVLCKATISYLLTSSELIFYEEATFLRWFSVYLRQLGGKRLCAKLKMKREPC